MFPQPTPSGENLLLGKGSVYFALRTNGVLGPLRHMGNVKTFEFGATDDVLEKRSSMNAAATLLKSVTKSRDMTIKMDADEMVPENVALALGAVSSNSTAQAATAIVGEVLSDSVSLGGYYFFAKVGPYTAVTLHTGVTPLVEGTDYTIDLATGAVHILPGATAIDEGDPLAANYTPTAYTAGLPTVVGGSKAEAFGYLRFEGDPTTGPRMVAEFWNVSIRPTAALALIGDDWATAALEAKVQDDTTNHPTAPLYKITYLPN